LDEKVLAVKETRSFFGHNIRKSGSIVVLEAPQGFGVLGPVEKSFCARVIGQILFIDAGVLYSARVLTGV